MQSKAGDAIITASSISASEAIHERTETTGARIAALSSGVNGSGVFQITLRSTLRGKGKVV